ncbi:MAG: sensor histidine kinase [Blautia sp.]|nr:sensor histidine kinase [Blautia sp.]
MREKRVAAALYFITVLLFLAVGGLYHIENFPKLLYGAVLTLVFWGAAGIWKGTAYVRRCRKLEEIVRHYEQSGELLTEGLREEGGALWEELLELLESVSAAQRAERGEWGAKAADCNDYYLMWTHQIKTPIAAMKLLLENGEEGNKNSFFMREELFKIEQYVDMVLTFQRLESLSSDLVLKEYDLYEILRQTVRNFSILFINRGLSLDLQEMHVKVLTDEKWLGFCIGQLISNSVKYTRQGSVTIRAGEEEECAILCVEDTGIGIRPEDLPRIFERGFTGYNGRMDERSTGIGLYLCHRIFGHLGIAVQAESQVGAGTRMTLRIPVRK